MEKVYIGKVVNTHGIKGEFRIKSDFELKSRVFLIGKNVFIDNAFYKIASYRVHKGYDMITVEGLNDINQVLSFKNKSVFVERESLELKDNEYLIEDYIGCDVVLNCETVGKVVNYSGGINPLLEVKGDKHFFIPLKAMFIVRFDKGMKVLVVDDSARGLMLWK